MYIHGDSIIYSNTYNMHITHIIYSNSKIYTRKILFSIHASFPVFGLDIGEMSLGKERLYTQVNRWIFCCSIFLNIILRCLQLDVVVNIGTTYDSI